MDLRYSHAQNKIHIYIYIEREREREICRVGKAINIINLIVWWQKINDLLWTAMKGFIRGKKRLKFSSVR